MKTYRVTKEDLKGQIKNSLLLNNETVYFGRHKNGKDNFSEIEIANDINKSIFYRQFPELRKPKTGDWGLFYRKDKNKAFISKLKRINVINGRYIPESDSEFSYGNFIEIDISKPLCQILKENGL